MLESETFPQKGLFTPTSFKDFQFASDTVVTWIVSLFDYVFWFDLNIFYCTKYNQLKSLDRPLLHVRFNMHVIDISVSIKALR